MGFLRRTLGSKKNTLRQQSCGMLAYSPCPRKNNVSDSIILDEVIDAFVSDSCQGILCVIEAPHRPHHVGIC